MNPNDLKGIPYGITDYFRMVRDDYYYVDKTHFIPLIEQAASFFFLIRPRRFGKSLLLSVLDAYYDINNADLFEQLFGERWIYRNPTKLRAQFLVIRFNFSVVDTDPARMAASFEGHCDLRFIEFFKRYGRFFPAGFSQELMQKSTVAEKLDFLNMTAGDLGLRIYLLIDEYDNFTNSILANQGEAAYENATHGEGFYRYFFNVLKGMTTGNKMAVERMFITGVSPITLDDVTSGYNIGTNFTIDPAFNSLIGFSETELRTMLEYYHERGKLKMGVEDMVNEMKPWYDNYCFAEKSIGENMYNSDMVLYYLNYYLRTGYSPSEMIDSNIRIDYNKLRHIIKVDKELGEGFSVIQEVVEKGFTTATINSSFPVKKMRTPDNFKSILFYFGLLSIQGTRAGDAILGIPNHTVREQMYSYLVEGFADTDIFSISFDRLGKLMFEMAYSGEWQAVFDFIASELEKQSRIREFIDGEAHVKGFLLAYLGLTRYYWLQPEYEMGKGYVDFYFQPNPQLTDMPYAYLLEVKYLKRDEPESRIGEVKEAARAQLLKYASDDFVARTLGGAKLRLLTVVFRGWEVVDKEEVTHCVVKQGLDRRT